MKRVLVPSSPSMRGQDVRDAQWLLGGHNVFKQNFHPGKVDGIYGDNAAAAARRAKWSLGYESHNVNGTFGDKLYRFLHGETKLSIAMKVRRKARAAQAKKSASVKARSLNVALHEAQKHVTESPFGSNNNPYGIWFGFNRVPWCAIFVS